MASRKSPIPSRISAERLKGELTGSRHSSNGSRRAESHSKVEDVILKHCLNESGFWGMAELTRSSREVGSAPPPPSSSAGESDSAKLVRFRFLEKGRRESEAAISEEERKWWSRGKMFPMELELELRGFEEGKRWRRRRRSWEIKEERRAARARESIFSLLDLSGGIIFSISEQIKRTVDRTEDWQRLNLGGRNTY